MSDWYLIVDKDHAPESCESFYWDPLLATVPGSSLDSGFANTNNSDEGNEGSIIILIGAIFIFLATIVILTY